MDRPTIIGVIGNTGSGKSSIINALLDEEYLVPTNWYVLLRYRLAPPTTGHYLNESSMRPCTSVVTEMRWNESNDENERYRAEIEFIQAADWEMVLRVPWNNLINDKGNVWALLS